MNNLFRLVAPLRTLFFIQSLGSNGSSASQITTFTAPYVSRITRYTASRHCQLTCPPTYHRITAILISRFLLELQETNRVIIMGVGDNGMMHSSRDPYTSAPSFISSLGAFINPDRSASSEDDLDLRLHTRSHLDGED